MTREQRVRRFLECAKQCEIAAQRANTGPRLRRLYLDMAAQWRERARQFSQVYPFMEDDIYGGRQGGPLMKKRSAPGAMRNRCVIETLWTYQDARRRSCSALSG